MKDIAGSPSFTGRSIEGPALELKVSQSSVASHTSAKRESAQKPISGLW
jgi:hypothetical protein